MLKKILLTVAMLVFTSQGGYADDYYNFGKWSIGSYTDLAGIAGFVDTNGKIPGGKNGDEYIIFSTCHQGAIYRVTVNGDPNARGDQVADRNFTKVSEHNDTDIICGGDGSFYVDDSGIYFGNAGYTKKVVKWDHNWTNKRTVTSPAPDTAQTLAYDPNTNRWWTATMSREVYRYNDTNNSWEYQFTYPNLAGGHNDGIAIVNSKLYLSDMTSDMILVYDLNTTTGDLIAGTDVNYTYTDSSDVEGMGYGPNQHFWFSSSYWSGTPKIYEVGDGKLVPSCKQTFNYSTSWTVGISNCNDITVPGIDDAVMVMVKVEDGVPKLIFATADQGAKKWLEALDYTVESNLTLQTGQGFFTFSKSDLSQTVDTGKAKNNYVNFTKDIITFVGFNISVDLNVKFSGKPVDTIWYYDGKKWNKWKPADGSETVVANQGLFVLPSGDFSLNIK